ncbi:serine/threonine protein kinase [Acinetobacter sp. S40]|uniref:serine/threonine protein kinase n=1 Tax=unclassified Acinetobacter TaxID=196816 RepID=UPI00190C93A4|nr:MULTISPECIES: serine/threonine protein kinase [unclassified Acinetobacter]MBJ9986028.1 serine/threonine protein kinase [Acinetobacter sp. S40]MBK0064001.1 serine/threonine protein kinase [Acinetobacter sp. S55]MBK0067286.1 serine/threonine protein kinase [Acinetobacter sp. S54]
MANFADFLHISLDQQNESIQAYELEHGKVWLKKASLRHSIWIYTPLRWLARFLHVEALTPVPNYGGKKAIQCEYQRITSLAKLGVNTPKVLALSDDGILLQDAANNGQHVMQLDHALAQASYTEQRLKLYSDAIAEIQGLHNKGSYLSEAFVRNILVDANHHFTFIDFETDPGEILDLKDCQIRDWLCFIFSSSYRFRLDELDQASSIFYDALSKNLKVFREICKIGHKLQWILHFKPEKLGNDGKRIQKCMLFLRKLEQQEPLPMI